MLSSCPDAMPEEQEQYYGFTQFAMELNELDSSLRTLLPPTDTRFRPDQRSEQELELVLGHLDPSHVLLLLLLSCLLLLCTAVSVIIVSYLLLGAPAFFSH